MSVIILAQKLNIWHKGSRSLSGEQLENLGVTELGPTISEVMGVVFQVNDGA